MGFLIKAVKSVVGLVVGIVTKVVGAIFGFSTGNKTKKAKSTNNLSKSLDPEAYRKIVFGKVAAPLDVRFWQVWGTGGTQFDEVIALASHRCNSVKELYFEEKLAFDASGTVQSVFNGVVTRSYVLGTVGQAALSVGDTTQYSSAATFDGCCAMKLSWLPDEKKLPNGIPSKYTQVVEGALVYDPRRDSTVTGGSGAHRANDQTTWEYAPTDSNGQPIGRNNALQALWYLLGWTIATKDSGGTVTGKVVVCGRGIDPSDINMATFIAGANNCEVAGYYTDLNLTTEDDHTTNEGKITCNGLIGRLIDPGGLWSYYANINDTASIAIELTDADIADNSTLTWNEFKGMSEQFNQVVGKFVNPSASTLFQPFPYPMVRDATYETNLGVKRRKTQDYEQVLDGVLAQRLSRLMLNAAQYQGELQASFLPRAINAQAWDVVRYTSERFGWTKLFRVWRHDISTEGGVGMLLKEIHSSIWSAGTVLGVTAPGVGAAYNAAQAIALTGLAVALYPTVAPDGTKGDGFKLAWTAPPINVRRTEIRYRLVGSTFWNTAGPVERDVTSIVIAPLFSGAQYELQARHISITEIPGAWNAYANTYTDTTGNINAAAITAAGGTAIWSNITGTGKPANNADVTSANIAAGIINQGALAILSAADWTSNVTNRPLVTGQAVSVDEFTSDLTRWSQFITGAWTKITTPSRRYSNTAFRTGTAGDQLVGQQVPFDRNATYALEAWFDHVGSNSLDHYFGVKMKDSAGTDINSFAGFTFVDSRYTLPTSGTPDQVFLLFGAGTDNPFPANAVSIAPMVFLQLNGTAGYAIVEGLRITKLSGIPEWRSGYDIGAPTLYALTPGNAIKVNHVTAWDSATYTRQSYKNIRLTGVPVAGKNQMIGLTNTVSPYYNSATAAVQYYNVNNHVYIFENGVSVLDAGVYATPPIIDIDYNGGIISYYANGILLRIYVIGTGFNFWGAIYGNDPGSGFNSLVIGPSATIDFALSTGTTKPSDNAGTTLVLSAFGANLPIIKGNQVTKLVSSAFDSAAVGQAFAASAYVTASRTGSNDECRLALGQVQANLTPFNNDFFANVTLGGSWFLYVSGTMVASGNAGNATLTLAYTGSSVIVLVDGIKVCTYTTGITANLTLYPKVLIYYPATFANIFMGYWQDTTFNTIGGANKPANNADVTAANIAQGFSGQTLWATYSGDTPTVYTQRVQYMNTSGFLSSIQKITDRNMTYLVRADGTTAVTENAIVTGLGIAQGFSGQALIATNPDFANINGTSKPANNATLGATWGIDLTGRPAELTDGRITAALDSSGDLARNLTIARANSSSILRYTSGGLFTGELAADITGTHVASSITGQGNLAVKSTVTYGTADVTGFGAMAARVKVSLGDGFSFRNDGTTALSDGSVITLLGVASSVTGQALIATNPDFANINGTTKPEANADVTLLVTGGKTISIGFDYTGTVKADQLPLDSGFKLFNGSNTDVTSSATWTASTLTGTATYTIGTANGIVNVTALGSTCVIQVTATYNGKVRKANLSITKIDDSTPPPAPASGNPATTVSASVSGTATSSYGTTAFSGVLSVKAGTSGQVACSSNISFNVTSTSTNTEEYGKWQWRVVGGTFADIATEIISTSSAYKAAPVTGEPTDKGPGALSVNMTKTGLTSGTTYEFQLLIRTSGLNCSNSGSSTAAGS